MSFCHQCGAMVAPDDPYCGNCGAAQQRGAASVDAAPSASDGGDAASQPAPFAAELDDTYAPDFPTGRETIRDDDEDALPTPAVSPEPVAEVDQQLNQTLAPEVFSEAGAESEAVADGEPIADSEPVADSELVTESEPVAAVAEKSTGEIQPEREDDSVPPTARAGSTGGRQATSKQLEAGTVLNGRYEIVRRIGGGGMGAVYLAKDHNLGDAPRAVKEMIESHLDDSQHESVDVLPICVVVRENRSAIPDRHVFGHAFRSGRRGPVRHWIVRGMKVDPAPQARRVKDRVLHGIFQLFGEKIAD